MATDPYGELDRLLETDETPTGQQMRAMLSCDYGTKIALEGDEDSPCRARATSRVMLHVGSTEELFKFCDPHEAVIRTQTTPHAED